jgi:glycerophosphoryl diester phosphodiesterase
MKRPELIAHRGYARCFPENTLVSVQAALEVGARCVEVDVQLSRDRVPFLMHDRTLERMCAESGPLGERMAVELETLCAAERERFGERFADEPLASLSSFVALVARAPGVHAFVELKRASIEQFGCDAVLDAVLPRLEPLGRRCTLISFDTDVLRRARARGPRRLGPVLIHWSQFADGEVSELAPDVIFCDLEKLPPDARFPDGVPFAIYEVDRPELALDLAARGARFVETFAIREMLEALA